MFFSYTAVLLLYAHVSFFFSVHADGAKVDGGRSSSFFSRNNRIA